MQVDVFSSDSPGRLVKAPGGYSAFFPDPLPPKLEVSWELAAVISNADRALSELAGVVRTLPNPHLLMRPFMRREAVLSSRIEGTRASLSDLFLFEAANEVEKQIPEVREISNYVSALEHGLARLAELPLSLRLIREMHAHLMAGVRAEHSTPGEFRRSQNWIGPPGCALADAVFVPPPEPEMKEALAALETYLHSASPLPPLVRLALIHYQFEAIHPFLDGNGRIGRLLIILLLCYQGLLPQPLLYISAYFERHRQTYYQGLLDVSRQGRWQEWIEFFLNGVAEQSRDAVQRSHLLLELREEYRQRLGASRSASPLRLAEALFSYPALTIPAAAKLLDVTWMAARGNVFKLVAAGILQESPGRERNRIFMAREIVEIVEAQDARDLSPSVAARPTPSRRHGASSEHRG